MRLKFEAVKQVKEWHKELLMELEKQKYEGKGPSSSKTWRRTGTKAES